MAKSLKKNFIYNILLNISKVIFPLITAPYVSRILEPDGVGLFNFANTYANWFALFAALGIPYYGIREIAKIRDNTKLQTEFVSEIISLSLLSTMFCTLIMFISLIFVPQLSENHLIFLTAGIVLYITPFKVDWFFSGKEDFGYITFRSLVIKTLGVLLLFLFVHNKNDLLLYVFLNALCQVINEIWNYIKMYKSGVRPHFTLNTKKHIKPLLLLFSSTIAISVYTILDTLMLGFMSDYSEVGFYNSATHISKGFLPVVTSLATVAMPRLSNYLANNSWDEIQTLSNRSLSVISFICFPMAFGLLCISPTFIPLFLGTDFYGAIIPLQILSILLISIGLNNFTGVQILVGLGYDKLFLYSVLSGMIINFILNLLLIPHFGSCGAAIASVIAETIILFITARFVVIKTPIRFQFKEVVQNISVSLVLFPIAFILSSYLSEWNFVFVYMVLSCVIYITFQLALGNSTIKMVCRNIRKK